MKRFEGKVAFVTGAAAGIGRATALRLASEGASLYIVDLAGDTLAETAKLCEQEGAAVVHAICDVTSEEQIQAKFFGPNVQLPSQVLAVIFYPNAETANRAALMGLIAAAGLLVQEHARSGV